MVADAVLQHSDQKLANRGVDACILQLLKGEWMTWISIIVPTETPSIVPAFPPPFPLTLALKP